MRKVYLLASLSNASVWGSLIFIPLLAKELSLSYLELGLIGTSYGLACFLSYYIFGRFSDLLGRRKIFVEVGFLVCAMTFAAQILMRDFASMALIRGVAGFSLGIFWFPLVAYISEFPRYEKGIGRFVGFGALGSFAGSLLAGMIGIYNWIFTVASFLFLAGFFVSTRLPAGRNKRLEVPLAPFKLIRNNASLYSSYFLRQLGSNSIWIIFPLFLVELGADKLWIAVIYSLNWLTQFFVMNWAGGLAEKIDERILVRIGLSLSAIVFLLYSFATSFYQVIPIQFLLGIAWGSLYVGSLIYLLRKNVERATSTGLLGSTMSLSAVFGPLFGGLIAQFFGLREVMYFAFALTIASVILSRHL